MNRNSMPLDCTICANKPAFSDISHLLTHISSKQHLSNYFKIQVQSNGDDEAQALLDRYDSWYQKWEMGEMLKERMDQKAKKKSNVGTQRRSSNVKQQPRSSKSRTHKPEPRVKAEQSDSQVKLEPQYTHSFPPVLQQAYGPMVGARPLYAPFPQWPVSPMIKMEEDISSDANVYDEEEQLLPPYPRRSLRNMSHSRMQDELEEDTSASEDEYEETIHELEVPMKEGIKLKGVYWPGMDLFDSATPEMQRKRNQKKTTDVMAQLEATSKVIEPEEIIYDLSGQLLTQREITGNPDIIGTPLRGESTPDMSSPRPAPKQRKTRMPRKSRAVLAERDANASIGTRRSRRHTSFGSKRRSSYIKTSDGEDNGFTHQNAGRRRGGISIHRDNSGPDITLGGQVHAQQPFGGYQMDMMGGEHAFSPYGPLHGAFDRRSNHFAAGMDRATHLPPMRDLSTFGQLSHSFRSSYNPFINVDNARRGHARNFENSSSFGASLHPMPPHNSIGVSHAYPPHLLPSYIAADGHTGLGMFDRVNGHACPVDPVFWGDEQVLPDEQSVKDASQRVKQEDDGDDETISLSSDKK